LRATLLAGVAAALADCASIPPPAAGPVAATITIVERSWHTDVCLNTADADAWVTAYARGFDGARALCFGFGERQYVVRGDHGVFTMLSAMLPSRSALLMTALRDTPAAAFGAANVVPLGIARQGLTGLEAFLRTATEIDDAGRPRRLASGPYIGSVYFAATATYFGLYTCNTWTADAMRAAGLPVSDAVLFAGGVMRQARALAAAQGGER
jgi:hypothetical protein